MMMLMAGMH